MKADFDPKKVQLVAFDLFGTLFELNRPRAEILAYAAHIRKPTWSPLELPESWGQLTPFADTERGLAWISEKYRTAALSNAPRRIHDQLCGPHLFSNSFCLDRFEVFKPCRDAYVALCIHSNVLPSRVLMVTANESFGDLESSRSVGMQAQLIDRANKYGGEKPRTIIELAELFAERGGA
jgi:FMN phosphatase YigB (HAD superfamily)